MRPDAALQPSRLGAEEPLGAFSGAGHKIGEASCREGHLDRVLLVGADQGVREVLAVPVHDLALEDALGGERVRVQPVRRTG
jgi:hypothetical protein